MPNYSDNSYPPIGPELHYRRGDGALITLRIEPDPDCKPPPIAPPAPALLNLFEDALPPAATTQHVHCRVPVPAALAKAIGLPRVHAKAALEGTRKPMVAPQPKTAGAAPTGNAIDHPSVGGKFTIFVLLYGPPEYHNLHVRCINAILATVPKERRDLRIGSNALCQASVNYVNQLKDSGEITKHYCHQGNDYKYPVMREMFHDPMYPILTKWVLWFDDDSIADRDPNWLTVLSQTIVQCHTSENAHMVGAKFVWTMTDAQRRLIRQRPWYRNRPFRQQNGQPSPSGNKIIFCVGGFWALTKQAIDVCDIPDVSPELGLTHNGGDWIIGEQLYQGGFNAKTFNAHKQFVFTSSVPRRGVTMPVPGGTAPRLRQL